MAEDGDTFAIDGVVGTGGVLTIISDPLLRALARVRKRKTSDQYC
jgi:hypothetical protein